MAFRSGQKYQGNISHIKKKLTKRFVFTKFLNEATPLNLQSTKFAIEVIQDSQASMY